MSELKEGGPALDPDKFGKWSVSNLIDFEVAIDRLDDSISSDRSIFLEKIRPALGDRISDRSAVFLAWLHFQGHGESTIGSQFEIGVKYVALLIILLGFFTGLGTTAGILSHDNAQPINAASFLAVTVGLQLGVIAIVLGAMVAQKVGFNFSPMTSAISGLVLLTARALNLLDGEQRNEIRFFLAKTGEKSERLGPFISLQLLKVTQAFAITFNLAILGSMLFYYLPFSELRFGWQTTYMFLPETVSKFVQAIAVPWSWISGSLVPSMQQVLDTQVARGQSSLSLDASSVHAWWPFLLCAVAFYGLLPRLIVVAALEGMSRWRMQHIRFDSSKANALGRRLQPMRDTSAGTEVLQEGPSTPTLHAGGALNVLAIKSDASTLSNEEVSKYVHQSLGWQVVKTISACIDDDNLTESLSEGLQGRLDGVVVVAPGTQDPIVAIAGFLEKVRTSGRPDGEVIVLLTGKPGSNLDARFKIWSRFIAINKLHVGVELCQ